MDKWINVCIDEWINGEIHGRVLCCCCCFIFESFYCQELSMYMYIPPVAVNPTEPNKIEILNH